MTVKRYGIHFNGLHSVHDLGILTLESKSIGIPNKKKVTVQVPFSNEVYDFSTVYGGQLYDQRQLVYNFKIKNRLHGSKEAMNMEKINILNWLFGTTGYTKLVDDAIPGYYFLAEVQGNTSFEEEWAHGVLKVTFTAYPFKIAEKAEGDDIWDDFNFELDVFQATEFDVDGTLTTTIVNPSISLARPEITASSDFTVILNNTEHTIKRGTATYDYFTFDKINTVTIKGKGHISFKWFKELI
ncbi:TPA: phage tail protein [Streptococcus suis]|nr:phage tail protein [Streptococcus suis]